jgi:hypothetical protein
MSWSGNRFHDQLFVNIDFVARFQRQYFGKSLLYDTKLRGRCDLGGGTFAPDRGLSNKPDEDLAIASSPCLLVESLSTATDGR